MNTVCVHGCVFVCVCEHRQTKRQWEEWKRMEKFKWDHTKGFLRDAFLSRNLYCSSETPTTEHALSKHTKVCCEEHSSVGSDWEALWQLCLSSASFQPSTAGKHRRHVQAHNYSGGRRLSPCLALVHTRVRQPRGSVTEHLGRSHGFPDALPCVFTLLRTSFPCRLCWAAPQALTCGPQRRWSHDGGMMVKNHTSCLLYLHPPPHGSGTCTHTSVNTNTWACWFAFGCAVAYLFSGL